MTTKGRKKVKYFINYGHYGYEKGTLIDAYIYKEAHYSSRAILLIPKKECGFCDCLIIAEKLANGNWVMVHEKAFMNLQ
jgi:hypothetical protein